MKQRKTWVTDQLSAIVTTWDCDSEVLLASSVPPSKVAIESTVRKKRFQIGEHLRTLLLILTLYFLPIGPIYSQTLAFPEAEGFGRFATGARGNLSSATVYRVTNLNDSGAGSFRDAVSQGNRFIVFDVSGIITLNSAVSVDKSNLYIAGQTSPGGISFYGDKVAFSGANNLISRYFSIRKGEAGVREDSSGLSRGANMIFDHMSVTWGVDETFSMNPASGQTIDNITIQNTIIGQGLDRLGHSAGGLMTIDSGRFSVIKSLFADNVTRNPKVRGNNEFINNVVYGYETAGYIMGDTTATSNANVEGNYFIEGPVDGSNPFASGTSSFNIYTNDNWVDTNRDGVLNGSLITSYLGANVVGNRHAFPTMASMTAQQAVDFVIKNVGANIIPDAVDKRIIQEVASFGTLGGVILRETDLFPNWNTDPIYLNPRARLVDTDNDGMPDNWESSRGLNPNNAADFKNLSGGYTRLEEYLNELGGYGNTRTTTGGAWTSAATWGGATPTFASTAVVQGGLSHAAGNAFARQLILNGSSTMSGGTMDIFDTVQVGSGAIGSMTLTGGTMTAGRVMLGGTTAGSAGTLTLSTGATLQTATIGSEGGTASLVFNGGTYRALGAPNISIATTIQNGGGTINTNGFSGSISGVISGAGKLMKSGSGNLTLSGNNSSFSGGVDVLGGSLTVSHLNGAGTGAIRLDNATYLPTISNITNPIQILSTGTIQAGGLTVGGAITGAAGTTLNISTTAGGTSNMSLGGELSGFAGTINFTGTGNVRINRTGSSQAAFNLGNSTTKIRTATGGNVNMGALSGGSSTSMEGATNNASLTNYVVGALNTNTTYSGIISNGSFAGSTTGLTKVGSGTLTLGTANNYTGATVVQLGTLSVANLSSGGTVSSIGQSTSDAANLVINGGTLRYTGAAVQTNRNFTLGSAGGRIDASGTGTLEFRNNLDAIALSGSGPRSLTLAGTNTGWNSLELQINDGAGGATSVIKEGSGTWRLLGRGSAYSGGTHVRGGTLIGWYSDTMPTGDLTIDAGATFDTNGNSRTVSALNGGGTFLHGINTARQLTVGSGNANGLFSGVLVEGTTTQTLSLRKIGTGTQSLSGNNLYRGTTEVSAGSLIVNGQSGTGLMTVRSGATLGGSGTVGGSLLAQGVVSPGNSPGTLTVAGDATFADGSELVIELASPTLFDRLVVGGTLSLQSGSTLRIELSGLAASNGQQFDIMDWGNLTGTYSSIVLPNLSGGLAFNTSQLYSTGMLSIHLASVPEPNSALLALVGGLTLSLMRRRKQASF